MPYFPLTTFQEMILAFFLGLGTFILLYLAWGSYPEDRREGMEKEPEKQDAGRSVEVSQAGHGPQRGKNPVPPFLLFIYVGLAVWIVAYLIIIGLRVKAIG
jgi:hypothetical protein